jgi:hypothetical protein
MNTEDLWHWGRDLNAPDWWQKKEGRRAIRSIANCGGLLCANILDRWMDVDDGTEKVCHDRKPQRFTLAFE